jgi:transposase InsO family protein
MNQHQEYPYALKRRVGLWLKGAPRGSQETLASALKVSTRTVRSWKSKAQAPPKKRGRKKTGVTLREKLIIAREWRRQGYPGSRPIIKSLPNLRVRAIREVIAGLKQKKKKRYRKNQIADRTSVMVCGPGIMTAMDAATIPVEGGDHIMYRDRGILSTNAEKCEGENVNSGDTLEVLSKLKENGELPFVLATDNGSPFVNGAVDNFLKENKVIQLKSLPRVPQQNGSAEATVCDVKSGPKYGLTVQEICFALNQHRRRATLNWQTPAQARQTSGKLHIQTSRDVFYEAACSAIKTAVLGTKNAKEKRKAEREAIFQTLENFSLIVRTRGCRSNLAKAEEIT